MADRGTRRSEVPLPPMPAAWREPADDTLPTGLGSAPVEPPRPRPPAPPPPRPPVLRSPVVRPPSMKPGYYGMPIAPPQYQYPPQRYGPPGSGGGTTYRAAHAGGYSAGPGFAAGAPGYAGGPGFAAGATGGFAAGGPGYAAGPGGPGFAAGPGGTVAMPVSTPGARPVSGTRPVSPIPYPGLPASAMPAAGPGAPPHPAYAYPGEPLSDRSGLVAGMLQLLLGWVGAGRLYTGHVGIALAQFGIVWVVALLTLCAGAATAEVWVLAFLGMAWPAVDGIILLSGGQRDRQGRRLR